MGEASAVLWTWRRVRNPYLNDPCKMANAEVNAYKIYTRHQLICLDNYIQYGNKIFKADIRWTFSWKKM
jgi:hypothetical protein